MIRNLEVEITNALASAQQFISVRKYNDALRTLSFLDTLDSSAGNFNELISLGYSIKALSYRMLSIKDKAVHLYEKALLLNGNSITALTGLAALYSSMCQHQKAKSIFERVLSIDANNIPARRGLVQANRSLGLSVSDNSLLREEVTGLLFSAEEGINNDDTTTARKALFKILLKDPLHIDALNGLSVCDIMEQNIDHALEKISTILKIDAENETATANYQYIKERITVAVNA